MVGFVRRDDGFNDELAHVRLNSTPKPFQRRIVIASAKRQSGRTCGDMQKNIGPRAPTLVRRWWSPERASERTRNCSDAVALAVATENQSTSRFVYRRGRAMPYPPSGIRALIKYGRARAETQHRSISSRAFSSCCPPEFENIPLHERGRRRASTHVTVHTCFGKQRRSVRGARETLEKRPSANIKATRSFSSR